MLDSPVLASRREFLRSRATVWAGGGLIALAVFLAYANSFHGPFVFDDVTSVLRNPTIHSLRTSLAPPSSGGLTVSGRPLVNFSLAINYALSGTEVRGYHLVNLCIHLLATLTLFGLVRRTLMWPRLAERYGHSATALACAVALLWGLHPLQTESVTYIVQRAESLAGLFYLLTMYCFVRFVDNEAADGRNQNKFEGSQGPGFWALASVLCCLLGMTSKETMVSAPIIVFLYDCIFVAGTFREAWKKRRRYYLALAATWLLLGWLVFATAARGGTAGFHTKMPFWPYVTTQTKAIVHYLQLSLWPQPLVFDYGITVENRALVVASCSILLAFLFGATVMLLKRRPAVGFLGVWFFAVLAPSSSIIPIATETMAEHRMYLALAPELILLVLCFFRVAKVLSWPVFLALAIAAGLGTHARNNDYRTAISIWSDTLAKKPGNPRAHCALGYILAAEGRTLEAIAEYKKAITLAPDYAEARNNLATLLKDLSTEQPASQSHAAAEAVTELEEAIKTSPASAEIRINYANALLNVGRIDDALAQFDIGLRLNPAVRGGEFNLANALARLGRTTEAAAHYEKAIAVDPSDAEAHTNYAVLLRGMGKISEAIAQARAATQLQPASAIAHNSLGVVLATAGSWDEAIAEFQEAARLQPDLFEARVNFASALAQAGHLEEAAQEYKRLLPFAPSAELHNQLGAVYARLGRLDAAKSEFQQALRLDPNHADARENLQKVDALQQTTP